MGFSRYFMGFQQLRDKPGGKGYTRKEFCLQLSIENKTMYALKRPGNKKDWPASILRLVFKNRHRIETTFSQLSGQPDAENIPAKNFRGLCTRLSNKILGYNLCIVINYIFNIIAIQSIINN